MINLNVGPSKISENTKKDIRQAIKDGIYEISHRSKEFSLISQKTVQELRIFFNIPYNYRIFYVSSSTEAMELCLRNCCKKQSFHFISGNFSNVFKEVAQQIGKKVYYDQVVDGEQNDFKNVKIPQETDFISITHNETSTGVLCSNKEITLIREQNPKVILAVDITSSAGVAPVNISDADLWFFSIQKGFGLPAGMGVIFASPRSLKISLQILEKEKNLGYFSFPAMEALMQEKYQTLCTPNVINIYLLNKKLERLNKKGGVQKNFTASLKKFKIILRMVEKSSGMSFFSKNLQHTSYITPCLQAKENFIKKIHNLAKKNGFILGEGYGKNKFNTFRIANFPNIKASYLNKLSKIISQIKE